MCVGFWSLEHPDYALILCTNRDEYLSRPTSHAHWHTFEKVEEGPDGAVLSGRDLRAGGTWLGINRLGDVAFLTNITEEPGQYNSTRGELTSSFLLPDHPATDLREYVDGVVARNTSYAGFNLLLLAPTLSPREVSNAKPNSSWSYNAEYLTNSGGGGRVSHRHLTDAERRCGGLSNGIDGLGAEKWPKVQHGSQLFLDVLNSISADLPKTDLVERLFGILTWKSDMPPRARSELRNTIQIEPMGIPFAQSADGPLYGTRLSTVILVDRDGNVLLVERDIWMLTADGQVAKGDHKSDRVFEFKLDITGR